MSDEDPEREIRALLRLRIEEAGGVSKWARLVGINRAHVSKALHGRRAVGPKIVRALAGKDVTTDPRDVRRLLREEVKKAGGQTEWAHRNGVSRETVNKMIRGKRNPTADILRALNIPRRRIGK